MIPKFNIARMKASLGNQRQTWSPPIQPIPFGFTYDVEARVNPLKESSATPKSLKLSFTPDVFLIDEFDFYNTARDLHSFEHDDSEDVIHYDDTQTINNSNLVWHTIVKIFNNKIKALNNSNYRFLGATKIPKFSVVLVDPSGGKQEEKEIEFANGTKTMITHNSGVLQIEWAPEEYFSDRILVRKPSYKLPEKGRELMIEWLESQMKESMHLPDQDYVKDRVDIQGFNSIVGFDLLRDEDL